MKLRALVLALAAAWPVLRAQDLGANINSRYVVESVEVAPSHTSGLSRTLREDMKKLVGEKLNQSLLDSLKERLRQETGARLVRQKLSRGEKPDTVKVTFELRYGKKTVDVNIPKLAYLSRQGFSGGANLEANFAGNTVGFGYVNDGEALVERYAGIHGYYERKDLWLGRIGFRFDAQDYSTQWNDTTLAALGTGGLAGTAEASGIYRARMNFEPALTVRLVGPLTWIGGVSFQRLETQYPAAHIQGANAVVQSLRLRQQWRESGFVQTLDAEYGLHAAIKALDSDFSYTRHQFDVNYGFKDGPHQVVLRAGGGLLNGQAPYFERFSAGNLTVLRGWSKWDLTPTGASRLAYGSAEYRYKWAMAFYDTGTAWDRDGPATLRHSVGIGVRTGEFFLALAFPLQDHHVTPLFMAGLNF